VVAADRGPGVRGIEGVRRAAGARGGDYAGKRAVGVEIQRRGPGAGQGPFAFGPPGAAMPEPAGRRAAVITGPHDVEPHWRVAVPAVRLPAEPPGRPAPPKAQQGDPRPRP